MDQGFSCELCELENPAGKEVQTTTLLTTLLGLHKEVTVPLMLGKKTMTPCSITGLHDLVQGAYDFLEPQGRSPYSGTPDICILPCLGLSENGARLGSGAGCYDHYLATCQPLVIGLAYERQILPNIPQEQHDKPVHIIITEQRVIRTKTNRS